MKILLIEDDKRKRSAITSHLLKNNILQSDIIDAKNMTDFAAALHHDIGLFIIDFKLPNCDDGTASQNGKTILESIIKSGKQDALLLAISSYPNDFPELRELYESHGCILSDFSNKKGWQSTLEHLLIQLRKNINFDFIIFCALQEERNPYVTLLSGKQLVRGGIDFYDVDINGKKGGVVLLPQMGLVNAAIIAAICIDRYKPIVIAMSGVCGGFPERAKMGQLLISGMVYEYQSGKWAQDGFKHEPYQVSTDHITLTNLRILANKDGLIAELEKDFYDERPKITTKPDVGVFTSGSAVIADNQYLDQIQQIHRKVNGLDMEIFALQRAAELSIHKPSCICAKTVVDLCDKNKNDNLHSYGSFISARFIISAINDFFINK